MGGDFRLRVEAAVTDSGVDLDHREERGPSRQTAVLGRAHVAAPRAGLASRCIPGRGAAIGTQIPDAPPDIQLPAVGPARRAARLDRGTAPAARAAVGHWLPALAAPARRPPALPPGALGGVAPVEAGLAPAPPPGGWAVAALGTELRGAPGVVPALALGARLAAADLGTLAAIGNSRLPGSSVSPAIDCAAVLSACSAQPAPGLWRSGPALGAEPGRGPLCSEAPVPLTLASGAASPRP